MKKLLVLNTDPKEFSYGGVCPFMRNMHPFLEDSFELDYITLPDSWKKIPGSTRMKYLVYLWLHREKLNKCDYILSHGPEGSYVASFSKTPYAHVYHGNSNPMTISRFKIGKYFAKMYDKMFERIDQTASLVYTVGPVRNERQKKLHNPLNQNVKPRPVSERHGFIFAGRLEAMKNVDRLIRIYSKLPANIREENPFYIAGFGTQETYLRGVVDELSADMPAIKEQVVFLGKIENTKMLEVDSDKKILLMASTTEGMPTAIAEAFSVGLPVVSTAVGDIPSVVQNGKQGELLPVDFEDDAYIDAILRILEQYDSYSVAAYESSKVFNARNVTEQVISDINVLLNGGE